MDLEKVKNMATIREQLEHIYNAPLIDRLEIWPFLQYLLIIIIILLIWLKIESFGPIDKEKER